jgi:hypothetical protein
LALDGDYIHIMPSDQKTMYEPGNPKTSSIFIGAIVSAKQYRKIPQNFKVSSLIRMAMLMTDHGFKVPGNETLRV